MTAVAAGFLLAFSPAIALVGLALFAAARALIRPTVLKYAWALGVFVVTAAGGCTTAQADRGVLFTENGIRAAEMRWDEHFWGRLKHCSEQYEPGTSEATDCFGKTASANKAVDTAVQAIVPALRLYWAARAAGESPDWATTAAEVSRILGDLPPDVRQYFERVQGI